MASSRHLPARTNPLMTEEVPECKISQAPIATKANVEKTINSFLVAVWARQILR